MGQRIHPTTEPERALLVGAEISRADGLGVDSSLDELALLVKTAGAQVVGRAKQRLEHPHPRYFIGQGKLEEIQALRSNTPYNLVVFDDELSPGQQTNLEDALSVRVIDRTALILDVFAKRARTHEGRLQVELAQHQYLLPRLAGLWRHLERLGAGIGTRGPGEKQLETDRRLIHRRIQKLREELEAVRRHRAQYRRKRSRRGIPVVSLVGYTNTGKSTLFNALTRSEVFVEDKLFATLDPTTRRLRLPNGQTILLTDTVGFIHKLPPAVVAAFRATLEELEEADLLLHVVDIAHTQAPQQSQAVEGILDSLGLERKPWVLVLNKVDLMLQDGSQDTHSIIQDWRRRNATFAHPVVLVSATKGWGLDQLLHTVAQQLEAVCPLVAPVPG
ncbi:MAG: GTPase HflX [Chloroflexi bacterium]|nr:GTPase HflX [Chloroflexota bacterium]